MNSPKPYRAVVFHPDALTLWRNAMPLDYLVDGQVPVVDDSKRPNPSEVLAERDFRVLSFARIWCLIHTRRLRNVRAQIHVSP